MLKGDRRVGGVGENGHESLVDQRKESLHRLYVLLPVLSFLESIEGEGERERGREREGGGGEERNVRQYGLCSFLSLSLPPSLSVSLLVFL